MQIELTKSQLENLKIFLSRTDLKGAEVSAFVEIINIINQVKEVNNESH